LDKGGLQLLNLQKS